jgi:excisionase family DNA binding protein
LAPESLLILTHCDALPQLRLAWSTTVETNLSQIAPKRRRIVETPIDRRLASMQSAAAALGISAKTLWRILRAGDLPCVKLGGRTMVSVADLDAYVARQRGLFVAKVA